MACSRTATNAPTSCCPTGWGSLALPIAQRSTSAAGAAPSCTSQRSKRRRSAAFHPFLIQSTAQHIFSAGHRHQFLHSVCRAQQVEQTGGDQQPDSGVEDDIGGQLFSIAKWTLSLMMVIGIFYAVVFWGSGAIALFLKDKITFTKKDFIPYSERRRLEEEQQHLQQLNHSAPPPGPLPGQDSLLDLLPSPLPKSL